MRVGAMTVGIFAAVCPLFSASASATISETQSDIDRQLGEHVNSIRRAGGTDIIVDTAPYTPVQVPTSPAPASTAGDSTCTLQVVFYTQGDTVRNSSTTACRLRPTTGTMTPTIRRFDHTTTTWAELGRVTETMHNKRSVVTSTGALRAHTHTCTFAAATYGSVWFGRTRYEAYAYATGSFDLEE